MMHPLFFLKMTKICCTLVFCLFGVTVFAQPVQRTYRQASNCNCSLLTPTSVGSIQWYGSCNNGYCDGYGTVQYYDQDGTSMGSFVGNVSGGRLNGYGTRYAANGAIFYRGNLTNNEFTDEAPFLLTTGIVGDFMIDSLLSGGINRTCDIVKAVFSTDGSLQELRYRVTCNGQFMTENFYDCTLVITPNSAPFVDMVDVNDNAKVFITLNFLRYADRLLKWIKQQGNSQ
jgi:hypothetical protein